jgi:hypothetical protein
MRQWSIEAEKKWASWTVSPWGNVAVRWWNNGAAGQWGSGVSYGTILKQKSNGSTSTVCTWLFQLKILYSIMIELSLFRRKFKKCGLTADLHKSSGLLSLVLLLNQHISDRWLEGWSHGMFSHQITPKESLIGSLIVISKVISKLVQKFSFEILTKLPLCVIMVPKWCP